MATSRMAAASCGPRVSPSRSGCTTSSSQNSARSVPYGVYDIAANAGWVNLGISHDTAAFAVESIRRWWHELGAARYPAATRLADHRRLRRQQRHRACACGSGNCKSWPTNSGSPSPSTICRPAPAVKSTTGAVAVASRWVVGGAFAAPPSVRAGLAPSPVAARQTGHADRPHPAFTRVIKPSRSAGQHDGAARRRGRASRRDTRRDIGDTRCPLVRCVSPTIVEDAVAHTSARPCRSAEPALG